MRWFLFFLPSPFLLSRVEVRVSAPLDSTPQQRSWDLALVKILGRGALHFRNAEEKQLKAKTPIMGHILKVLWANHFCRTVL